MKKENNFKIQKDINNNLIIFLSNLKKSFWDNDDFFLIINLAYHFNKKQKIYSLQFITLFPPYYVCIKFIIIGLQHFAIA